MYRDYVSSSLGGEFASSLPSYASELDLLTNSTYPITKTELRVRKYMYTYACAGIEN